MRYTIHCFMMYINILSIKVRTAFMLLVWCRSLVVSVFWRTSSPSAKFWFKVFVKWTLLFIKKLLKCSCFPYRLSWVRLGGTPRCILLTHWHWPHCCKVLMRTKYSAHHALLPLMGANPYLQGGRLSSCLAGKRVGEGFDSPLHTFGL